MKLSVILPVYNVEKYLRECLDSFVDQTFQDFELIMVDDGSADTSGKICDEYAEKYNNFKVIHKTNEGLGMARNTALKIANGEYVYFFDSDDYLESDQLEIMINALEKNQADVCYVGFISINDNKEIQRKRIYNDEVFQGKEVNKELFIRMLGSSGNKHDSIEMSASAQMYSMKVIRENNLEFVSEREFISEDLVFNMNFLQYAKSACTIKESKNYYRYNVNSLSHKYMDNRFEKSKKFYLYMQQMLYEFGYGKEAIERLQKTFLINIYSSIRGEAKNTDKDKTSRKNKIMEICSDEVLRSVLNEYPTKKFGVKQRFFTLLLKYKMSFLLLEICSR